MKCEDCLYRGENWREGGWCYMWKESRPPCYLFKPVDITLEGKPTGEMYKGSVAQILLQGLADYFGKM